MRKSTMLRMQPVHLVMNSSEHIAISDEGYCTSFLLGLLNMQEQSLFTDITLRVQNVKVPCHRVVLCAATPYFHTMFNSDLKESSSSEVELKGLEGSALQQLVKYMYSAKIELHVGNVQSLAQACDLLHLSQLKEHCEAFMMSQVTPTNCLGLHHFANLYSLKQLAQTALKCMQDNFCEVVISCSEFLALTQEELVTYISDDHLNVPNENMVVEAVLEWVQADLKTRTEAVLHVAKHLRFSFCTKAYLYYQAGLEPLLTTCQDVLQKAKDEHLMEGQLQSVSGHLPRAGFKAYHKLVLLGGIQSTGLTNKKVWLLNQDKQQHPGHELCTLPHNFRLYSACGTPKGIVITGGVDVEARAMCWLFDSSHKRWEALPSMNEARFRHQAVYHDGDVFVLGGVNPEDTYLASAERLDLKSYQWEKASPMLRHLKHPLAVSFHSKLLVFSGRGHHDKLSCCTQEFDPIWNKWQLKTKMPNECNQGAAVCMGDTVYVVGGYSHTCLSYWPLTDTWCVLTGPHEKHGNAPAVVWRGKIVLGGGITNNKTTPSSAIEEFDPKLGKWSSWSQALAEGLECHHMLDVIL